jgi:Ca-activated chloride channel family protein
MNQNQQAKMAYDGGDYTDAMTKFDTPYQRGVAAYRAKQYDKAALLFKTSAATKPSLNALYDLGNAQLMQDQVEDAIASYRAALKLKPDDFATRHNLAIALKMLAREQQKQQRQKQQSRNNQGRNGSQSKQQGQQQGKGESQSRQASKRNPASPTANRGTQQLTGPSKADRRTAQQQGQQRRDGQGRAQPRTAQSGAPRPTQRQGGKQMGAPNPQYGTVGMVPPRTQRDVDADQWLTRVQSDPGTFLKNQFRIEDEESGLKQETPPR